MDKLEDGLAEIVDEFDNPDDDGEFEDEDE